MQPGFTPKVMALFEDKINTRVDTMLDKMAEKTGFDMVGEFSEPLMYQLLLGEVLGMPEQDWVIFSRLSNALALVATVPVGAPKPKEYIEAFTAVQNYCENLIAERISQPAKNDLIGALISQYESGSVMSTAELFSTLVQLLTGGLGTVIATMNLCVLRFCRHPDQLKLLQQDPALLNGAIEECLRIDSLGNFRHRFVVKDCVVDGTPLYRGMVVHVSMGASNYDPDYFVNPAQFDIKRNPKDISTFGHSIHSCVGNILARKILRRVVGQMVKRFPRLRLNDPKAVIIYGGMPTERFPTRVELRID